MNFCDNVRRTSKTCDLFCSTGIIHTALLQTRSLAFLPTKLHRNVLSGLDIVLCGLGFLEGHTVSQILLAAEILARAQSKSLYVKEMTDSMLMFIEC